MKNVMTRAWEIARKGQEQFGGKVSEYLAVALKLAWSEAKAPKTVKFVTTSGSKKHKSWVAKITGKHPKWKLNREFVEAIEENMMEKEFVLTEGIYEVSNAGDRDFIQVVGGDVYYIDYSDIMGAVA